VDVRHWTTLIALQKRKCENDYPWKDVNKISFVCFSSPFSPKYVHLINEQFYDQHEGDVKDAVYDLSTTSSSASTINPVTATASAHHHLHSNHHHQLSRLMQHEDSLKSSLENRLNGAASTSRKSLKHSPLQHPYTNSSSLVTVMMDENKPTHDTDAERSFYMSMRHDENGHHSAAEYDEGKSKKRDKK
jgi:hypothetical protein